MAQGDGGQVDWLDELVDALRKLHDDIIRQSGGVFGEHTSSLYAAAARPFQTAFGEELHVTSFEKGAALFHAVIRDHVFVDGNKRTATVGSILMLAAQGAIDLTDATPLQVRLLGDVAISTAADRLQVEEVTGWLRRIFDKEILSAPEV
jgi:death-on-curing family protein